MQNLPLKSYTPQSSYEEAATSQNEDVDAPRARLRNCREVLNEATVQAIKSNNLAMHIDDSYFGDSSPGSKPRRERKTLSSHIKFVDKSQWKDEKECFVCLKDFEKTKAHHCRACGHRVCGDCSDLRINDRRVCEICFKKQGNQAGEHMKEQLLHIKDHKEKVAQEQLEVLIKQSKKLQEDVLNYEEKLHQIEKDQGNKILSTEKEVVKLKDKLQAFKDKKTRLIGDIQDNYAAIENKQSKLKGIQMKLSILKLEVNQKKAIYEQKSEDLRAMQLKLDLRDASENSIIIPGTRNMRRNFTISDSLKDGRYSLTTEPVKI